MTIKLNRLNGKIILLSAFLLISVKGFSQYQDFEIWAAFSVRKNLTKDLRIDIEEGIRFNQNSTCLKKAFTDLGIKYKLNKYFAIAFNYRFVQKNNYAENFSYRHRFNFDFSAKKDIKRFETSLRLRYQSKFTDINSSDDSYLPTNIMRSRFSLEYDIAKTSFQPKLSVEVYHGLNSENFFVHNRTRYTLSGSYDITKKLTGELYYRIQSDNNVRNPLTSFIVGLAASYTF